MLQASLELSSVGCHHLSMTLRGQPATADQPALPGWSIHAPITKSNQHGQHCVLGLCWLMRLLRMLQFTNAGDQKILQRFREAMLLPNVFANDDDSDPNDPSLEGRTA